jgi:hypothetical protein
MARIKPIFYDGLLKVTLGSLLLPQMLEEVFYNKIFIQKVEKIRKKIGIPVEGLAFGKSETYYNQDSFPQLKKFNKYIKTESSTLAKEYQIPEICSRFIEAFILLDFDYELFSWYDKSEDVRIVDYGCALRVHKGYFSIDIFPGCTLNTIKDFLENYIFNKEEIFEGETGEHKKSVSRMNTEMNRVIPFKPRKLRPTQKYLDILKLFDAKKINSLGEWKSDESKPECIRDIGLDHIKKIIIEEKRRRKIRNRHGKWVDKYEREYYK